MRSYLDICVDFILTNRPKRAAQLGSTWLRQYSFTRISFEGETVGQSAHFTCELLEM
jgi:hypothetical protein